MGRGLRVTAYSCGARILEFLGPVRLGLAGPAGGAGSVTVGDSGRTSRSVG